ncbi:sugar ABC transporter permease, partial [Acinetobacter baumannii]|uniref:carbohydrate ABC transporter permease n=1 Tax=Acinetobacter baumannii TaxID=470 RepID=UPI0013D44D14
SLALLALFTHWTAVATIVESFYSTPRPRRPSRFTGLDNFEQMLTDPVFWQAMWNNLWFALGTIPVSIALALLMAIWVNDKIAGRTLARMAF